MMLKIFITITAIVVSVLVYTGARRLNQKFPHPVTLPILTSTVIMVVLLLLTGVSYDTYMIGGQWIEALLGPAVVALAYPLYNQRRMLKKYWWPIIAGVFTGTIVGVVTGYAFAMLGGAEKVLIQSVVPKSVTTPIAMEVSEILGGAAPLAALFVMVAGIGGTVISSTLFKWGKIDHNIGKGIAMGCASHAIGTAKALEHEEEEGAASSVAMSLSAIFLTFMAPIFVWLIS